MQPISREDNDDKYFFSTSSSIDIDSKGEIQSQTYSLSIEGVTVSDYGYWWCRVKVNDTVQGVPSAVLLLAPPCTPNPIPCPDSMALSRLSVNPRCALDQQGVLIEPLLPPPPPLCTSHAHTASVHPSPRQESSTQSLAASATPSARPPGEDNPVYGYVIVGLIGISVTGAVVSVVAGIILCVRKCRKRRGECTQEIKASGRFRKS